MAEDNQQEQEMKITNARRATLQMHNHLSALEDMSCIAKRTSARA